LSVPPNATSRWLFAAFSFFRVKPDLKDGQNVAAGLDSKLLVQRRVYWKSVGGDGFSFSRQSEDLFLMKLRHWLIFSTAACFFISLLDQATAQTPGVLYTWPVGTQDWFHNFGTGTGTLSNSGGALQIFETSATAGATAAYSDGFNTIHDASALFGSGCCGGIDLTGLSSLQFDIGHDGTSTVNVQFFTQATPASIYVALGPDLAVAPGINTLTVPLTVLTANQIADLRTIGINIRDHSGQGNLTWTLNEVRSIGTPLTTRVIADHDGGAADFDGLICNFDCGAISGGNGGQNNSGMSVVSGAAQWTDLGGGPGAAVTWGNGTQESGGSFNARPLDLSNYDFVTIRMSATGADTSVGLNFYMQTLNYATFQKTSPDTILPVDGAFHDVVFPLAAFTNRIHTDTNGINLFSHENDLVIRIDSVIYSQVPEPAFSTMILIAIIGYLGRAPRSRQIC
jgi:hypothetical protein